MTGCIAGRGTSYRTWESGLLSNTLKRIVGGNTGTDKARRGGEGVGRVPSGEQQDKERRRTALPATWACHLMVIGQAFSGVFPGGKCIPQPRLVGHLDWSLFSPFDLSWILLIGGSLLVLRSLPGPPLKITHASGCVAWPGRWFGSVFPLTPGVGTILWDWPA